MFTILVTGGAGFIGSHFVRYLLRTQEQVRVVNLDKLTYAGNLANLKDVADHPRYRFVRGDIADDGQVRPVFENDSIDAVVNFAAETHVDRSIEDASPFLRTNVAGTQCLLENARRSRVSRFVQISTDEVYGSLGARGRFREDSPLDPTSPYAASKAAADLLVLSYCKTYRVPAVITRCSNNYGPNQFPEKLIPLLITNAAQGRPLPIYGQGDNVREWLFVEDHSRAAWKALDHGTPGQTYNIGGGHEVANIDLAREILRRMGKPESLIQFVKDRPAHDLRYALDCAKITREWDWTVETDFDMGLSSTIEWYRGNQDWVRDIKDASYLSYYDRLYTHREQTLSSFSW